MLAFDAIESVSAEMKSLVEEQLDVRFHAGAGSEFWERRGRFVDVQVLHADEGRWFLTRRPFAKRTDSSVFVQQHATPRLIHVSIPNSFGIEP